MAIINFGLTKELSPEELEAIVNGAVKLRTRSSSVKRVYQENLATDKYFPTGKVTRGGTRSFNNAYRSMKRAEQELYQVWQIEVDERTIAAQPGGLEGIIESLRREANIEFAEKNQIYELSWIPDDPGFGASYALKKMECALAWNLSKGKGIKVAVIDSGLHVPHLEIARKIARNTEQKIIGYNFVNNNEDISDDLGHGTHVAGIIAAEGNNGQLITGVAPEAQIIPVKAFAGQQGDSIKLGNAIKFAVDNGADIINNSWAYESHTPKDSTLEKAINYALEHGVVCVFAAGNHNEEINNYWIAQHPDLIVVASTNQNDEKAPKSNWGDTVTLSAPGHEIISLFTESLDGSLPKSGTSMAAAHVSGALALYLALHGKQPIQTIKEKLRASVEPFTNTEFNLGSGRLNCFKLLS